MQAILLRGGRFEGSSFYFGWNSDLSLIFTAAGNGAYALLAAANISRSIHPHKHTRPPLPFGSGGLAEHKPRGDSLI